MAIDVTRAADLANQALNKEPNIVLKIDGVDTLYSAVVIKKLALYGDDIFYGDPELFYGGSIPIDDQENLVSFQQGTTSNISQQINIDTGIGNSIQSLQVALIDKDKKATQLISPGIVIDDILGQKCTIYYGFESTNFPEDYIIIFKGSVDDIDAGAGLVKLNIIASQKKQTATTFLKKDDTLNGNINASATTITLNDASDFFNTYVPPGGADSSLEYFIRINDEIIQYTGISGNDLTGCLRARLGTLASAHNSGDTVESIVRMNGNAMDLALKFMLSGLNDNYVTGLEIESFNTNTIFFSNQDLKRDHNISVGDFITITGSINPANDLTLEPITGFELREDGLGFNVQVATSLTFELDSTATASIRSKYDVWGEGRGLKMVPDEVDIERHIELKNSFLASAEYDFYLTDDIENGKEFIEQQLYNPIAAFSLNRSARASVGFQSPPQPGENIKILNDNNVNKANEIVIKRSSSKNFFNGVVYKIDQDILNPDRFLKREVVLSGPSISRFSNKIPNSYLVIEAQGFRESVGSRAIAQSLGNRRLAVYEFGAEFFSNVQVNLNPGLTIEAGDIVLLDLSSLKISDRETGTRQGEARLFRVDKKAFDLKKGQIKLNLIDTQFDKDARFGLISPASNIKSGISNTQFVISPSFGSLLYGNDEFRKWQDYVGVNVVIRNLDFSISSGPVELESISGNTITVSDMGFTPTNDMIMELAPYDDLGVGSSIDIVKIIFSFSTDDTNPFADNKPAYQIS